MSTLLQINLWNAHSNPNQNRFNVHSSVETSEDLEMFLANQATNSFSILKLILIPKKRE